ncbi:MAG: hypothetical protein KF858_01945 [Candidatus Sumerlaeia bacterium]|nr:hypothetical protein [Candidatus Sumerlaeia bacterium]
MKLPFLKEDPDDAELKKRPFLHWSLLLTGLVLAGLAAMVGFVSAAATGALESDRAALEIGRVIGSATAVLIWPLLLGWVAWRVGRRSRVAGSIIYVLVLVLFAFENIAGPAVRVAEHNRERESAQAEVILGQARTAQGRLRAAAEASLREKGYADIEADELDEILSVSITEAMSSSDPTVRAHALFGVEMRERMVGLARASEAWLVDGGIDTRSLRTREDLARREELRAAAQEAAEAVVAFVSDAESRMRGHLEGQGLSGRPLEAFMSGFSDSFGAQKLAMLDVRRMDVEVLVRAKKLHTLVEENWEHWEANDEGTGMRFGPGVPAQVLEEADRVVDEIVELSQRQMALQQQAIGAMVEQ